MDSHIAFRSKLDLPFSLLADEGGQVLFYCQHWLLLPS